MNEDRPTCFDCRHPAKFLVQPKYVTGGVMLLCGIHARGYRAAPWRWTVKPLGQ